jgi:hypothetical protein
MMFDVVTAVKDWAVVFMLGPEDGVRIFPKNLSVYPQVNTALQARKIS